MAFSTHQLRVHGSTFRMGRARQNECASPVLSQEFRRPRLGASDRVAGSTPGDKHGKLAARRTRVVLADDHAVMRQGLRSLLEDEADFEVVGDAGDGMKVLALVKDLRPDVVIMDVAMPLLNGIEATRKISLEFPNVRVLALSMHSDVQHVSRALRAGAAGYIVKECAFEEVVRAARTVANGRTYLGPEALEMMVKDYLRRSRSDPDRVERLLSSREREVLQLLAEGNSTKEIADVLSISGKTVETHRAKLMEKLGLDSVAELTKYAIREGITSLE
jgi:two-component system, NarL family, response regulator NreC